MPTIDDLSSVTSVSDSDQIPIFVTGSRTTRRATVSQLREAVEKGLSLPDGMLGISSLYIMRGSTPAVVPLTTTEAPFGVSAYSAPAFSVPGDVTSLTADLANGRFIAQRDIAAVEFWASVIGDWPSGSTLKLAVLVGDQVTPFESAYQFLMGGVGAGFTLTGNLSGPASNLNDTQGIIRAGQTIRLVASLSTPGNLNLQRIAFVVRPLDGQ